MGNSKISRRHGGPQCLTYAGYIPDCQESRPGVSWCCDQDSNNGHHGAYQVESQRQEEVHKAAKYVLALLANQDSDYSTADVSTRVTNLDSTRVLVDGATETLIGGNRPRRRTGQTRRLVCRFR